VNSTVEFGRWFEITQREQKPMFAGKPYRVCKGGASDANGAKSIGVWRGKGVIITFGAGRLRSVSQSSRETRCWLS